MGKTHDLNINPWKKSHYFPLRFLWDPDWDPEILRVTVGDNPRNNLSGETKPSQPGTKYPHWDLRADPLFNPVLNNDTSRELNRPSDSFYPSIRIFLINFNLETQFVSVYTESSLCLTLNMSTAENIHRKCIRYPWIWSDIKIHKQSHYTKPGYEGVVLVCVGITVTERLLISDIIL